MADKTKEKETKAVTPWRPFMDLTRWERDMDRMMEDFFGRRSALVAGEMVKPTSWMESPGRRCVRREGRHRRQSRNPRHGQRQHRSEPHGSHADDQGRKEKRGRGQGRELLSLGTELWIVP